MSQTAFVVRVLAFALWFGISGCSSEAVIPSGVDESATDETPADPGQDVTEPEELTQMTSEGKKFLISLGLKALRIDADLLSEDDLFKAADDVNDDNAEEMLDFLMNTVEEHK